MSYTIDSIIREHLIEIGDAQMNKYAVTMQRAVAGLRELNMDVSGAPTIIHLDINPNTDSVDLPIDYIQYIRIGLCGADGHCHWLARNDDLCLKREYDSCGNPTETSNNNVITPWSTGGLDGYADNYRNGECSGRFFGITGRINFNGEFRIDKERKTILLSALPVGSTSVILEYLGSLQKIGANYVVHPFVIETLKAWIWLKSIVYNPHRGLGEKDMAQRNYIDQKILSRRRFNAASFEDLLNAFRYNNSAAPRF